MGVITATFPVHIPADKVKFILEENMKKNSTYDCQVAYLTTENGENVFEISSENPSAFYYIGITAAVILEKYSSKPKEFKKDLNKATVLCIEGPDGKHIYVPFRQFTLNENQQFAVVGIDFQICGEVSINEDEPGIDSTSLGKLNEQNVIVKWQIINSLRISEWDFDQYPNPEIILLTKK